MARAALPDQAKRLHRAPPSSMILASNLTASAESANDFAVLLHGEA